VCRVGEGERHSTVNAYVPRLVRYRALRTAQEGAETVALEIDEFATYSASMSEDWINTIGRERTL
jgi:hypothetical protein